MEITFLGTGTSQGVPIIGCQCAVCKSEDERDKRLRSSVLISHRGSQFIIDAGPDFRQQMLRENVRQLDFVLLTHSHKDHTGGLDDIRAFNYLNNKAMDVYANRQTCEALVKDFYYIFDGNDYPGIPKMDLHIVDNEEFEVNNIQIQPIEVKHYDMSILGYRIGGFAYITDAKFISEVELNKLKNLNVLVINALRIKEHYSHFNLAESLNIVRILSPKHVYFTHISHNLALHAESKSLLPDNAELAYDGLKINID
ncbi:MAG: MBL fold metallo-hydrolase [Lentimicrobiaceae bacterium]|nr:MBL fold metallo-hydrolase [Lentimicrobiaceae bacterium]